MSRTSSFPAAREISSQDQRLNVRLIGGAVNGTACKAVCVYKEDAPISERFLVNSKESSLFFVGNPYAYEFYNNGWAPAMTGEKYSLRHNLEELFGGSIVWYEEGEANFENGKEDEAYFDWQVKVGSFVGFYTEINGELSSIDEDDAIEYLSNPAERAHLIDSAYIYFSGVNHPYEKDGKYIFELAKPVLVLYKQPLLFDNKALTANVTAGLVGRKAFKPINAATKAAKISARTEKKNRYQQRTNPTTNPTTNPEISGNDLMM